MAFEGRRIQHVGPSGHDRTEGTSAADFLHGDIIPVDGNDLADPVTFSPLQHHHPGVCPNPKAFYLIVK